MLNQISLFDGTERLKIDKPVRLIELFAGIGAQAKSLERLGIDFEHYRVCEKDKYAVTSYNAIHNTNFSTSDITKLNAEDLGVCNTDIYIYIYINILISLPRLVYLWSSIRNGRRNS